MANATVEKLKEAGLRHGEKAVVGLASVLFLLFVVLAITKKTTDLQPEAIKKKAELANTNLDTKQNVEDILKSLETGGIVATNFDKTVEKQSGSAINPADFKVAQKWVTPEPGAGLIRDQPQIIAPEELYIFPGRGGLAMFALDKDGKRIVDDGKDAAAKTAGRGRRSRGGMGGMMGSAGGGGMPGMMGGMGGGGGPLTPKQKEEAEKARQAEEARLKRVLVGKEGKEKPKTKEQLEAEKSAADAAQPQVAYKEETKGYRWVVVTGTLDNKKMKENWLAALKDPSLAYPNYARVDMERQEMNADGSWSAWAAVDSNANYRVLDNITETDEELAPEDVRLEALVDPLPFLRAGYWSGVHVVSLVPKEKRELPKEGAMGPGALYGPGMEGGYGGGRGGAMGSGMMGPGAMGGMAGGMRGGEGGGMPGMMGGSGGMGMMGGSGMGGYGGMGAMGGGAAAGGPVDDMNFPKSEQDSIMLRSLDFTVKPDTSYRYRVRIVVLNPNYLRSDVSAGTDTESNELKGPWSSPTEVVSIPPDIAAYALSPTTDPRRGDLLTFQVISWNQETGHTLVRNDVAAPGEIVGEYVNAEIPSSDGAGTTKNKPVDFNSRNIVLDVVGGIRPVPTNMGGGNFEMPMLSLLVRPDGSVMIRSQAFDVSDEVRVDMDNNYKQALKDSNKRRQPGSGGYDGGMMMGPGMGGMGGMGSGLR